MSEGITCTQAALRFDTTRKGGKTIPFKGFGKVVSYHDFTIEIACGQSVLSFCIPLFC